MAAVSPFSTHVFRFVAALALVAGLVCPRPAAAQAVTEPALKAAFLVNFVKFTQWPIEQLPPGAPVVLCVSDAAVAEALGTVAAQEVDGRRLVVRPIAPDAAWTGCTVAYVHGLDRRRTQAWLAAMPPGVLTVSDLDDFAAHGGIIQLIAVDGRMRFAVNVSEADRRRVRLSAKLLQLARIVRD